MKSILEKIVQYKKLEVESCKKKLPIKDLEKKILKVNFEPSVKMHITIFSLKNSNRWILVISAFSWTMSPVIICSNPFASIGLPLGLMNKKSGVALSTKNEAIFFGLANSFNNEIIVSLSFIKKWT